VPSWERSHTAVRELCRLIPNFQKKIDEGTPEELSEFYAEVSNINAENRIRKEFIICN